MIGSAPSNFVQREWEQYLIFHVFVCQDIYLTWQSTPELVSHNIKFLWLRLSKINAQLVVYQIPEPSIAEMKSC